jgi:CBS domain-containing protein
VGHARSLLDAPIRALGLHEPVSVAPGTSVGACLEAIERGGVGDSVMVRDADGRLAGVLTERDVFARLAGSAADVAAPVETLMNRVPHTLGMNDPVRAAIALMAQGRYRNIPLVDSSGRLLGVVRQQDILAFLAESYPQGILNLPPRPHQRLKEQEGA